MFFTQALQEVAADLLTRDQVTCVIGYEKGTFGRIRPAFIREPAAATRLVWTEECTHNLVVYLRATLARENGPVAIVVKPCDSRAINVLIGEGSLTREAVYVIGVVCQGVREGAGFRAVHPDAPLQARCQQCVTHTPVVYDTVVGEADTAAAACPSSPSLLEQLKGLDAAERAAFWLEQFDRCLRCYACRQACPLCNCPTCLYERDDALWIGMGTGAKEARTFHLGRALHLAGRCVGCNECERVCPMNIPIGLLNQRLAQEMDALFNHQAGSSEVPSPLTMALREAS
jgi:ferredoxin